MGTAEQVMGAIGVSPNLDAKTALSAAMAGGNVQESVQNAAVAANVGQTTNVMDSLKQQPASVQLKYWNSQDHAGQSKLSSLGYKPPNDPGTSHPSSIWGDILGGVKTAAGAVGSFVTSGVKGVAGQALNAANVPLREVQHTYRASQLISEDAAAKAGLTPKQIATFREQGFFSPHSGLPSVNPLDVLGSLVSPSEWARNWRASNNGEKTFDPAIEYDIKQKIKDPNVYNLAHSMASGDTPQQILGNTTGQQRANLVSQMQSPEVKSAVQQLNAAHISVGRESVGQAFIVNHPTTGKVLSGGIDGAFDVAADPTLQAGKITDAVRFAGRGVTTEQLAEHAAQAQELDQAARVPSAIEAYGQPAGSVGTGEAVRAQAIAVPDTTAYYAQIQKPAVQRWITTIGNAIATGGIEKASNLDSRVLTMGQALQDAGVHDPESLGHFMASQAGIKAVLEGKAATQHAGMSLLPALSPIGVARMQAKGLLKDAIDWNSEKGPNLAGHVLAPGDASTGSVMGDHTLNSLGGMPQTGEDLAAEHAPLDQATRGRLASLGIKGVTLPARTIRQMVTLTPTKGALDLNSDEAAVEFKRMLQSSMPAHYVNTLTNQFLQTKELGARFTLYKGGVQQVMYHAGIDPTSDVGKDLMKTIDDSFHAGTYAANGVDDMGNGVRAGLDLNDQSHFVYVPSFQTLRSAARRDAFYTKLRMGKLPDYADKAMGYWKAAVLLRPGFATRVALSDEAFSNVLRNGLGPYLTARFAAKHASMDIAEENYWKAHDALASPEGMPTYNSMYHGRIEGKIGAALNAITSNVPPELLAKVRSANDLASLVYGHAAHALYKAHGGTQTLPEYIDGAKSFYTHVWMAHNPLFDNIASVAHGAGAGDPIHSVDEVGGGLKVNLNTKRSGIYSEAHQSDPLFMQKWHFQLDRKATGSFSRIVLNNLGESKAFQQRKVLEAMRSGDFNEEMQKSARWNTVPGDPPRTVGVNATRDEALQNWSAKVVDGVHQAIHPASDFKPEDMNGPMGDVVRHMIQHGSGPDMDLLNKVPKHAQPIDTYGPEYVHAPLPQQLINQGFHLLSRQIDWINREPATLHAYTEALAETRPVALAMTGGNAELAEPLAAQMAAKRAMERVKPFIHSPEIRSQFEVTHRVAMPFLFAQDQFIKRWGRTFIDSPEGIRKAQLLMQGMESSGFVHKNAQGQDVFTYPGSQALTSLVAGVASKIGIGASLPVGVPWTGEVSGLMPGLQNPTTPSVGPSVAIPLKALANHFPELQPAQQQLLQGGASTSFWDQILPSSLTRLKTAVTGNPNMPGEYAAAMIYSMQNMEANGHGLPPNASTTQKQEYIDRLTKWTRSIFFTKALLGFIAPASPTANFDTKNLNGRLQELMSQLPYNEAIGEFMKEHPNASAYTVFKSASTGDVPNLPSTKAAGNFMSQNAGFVKDNPLAAGWFIPRTTGNQPYDPAVYREQLTGNMRREKLPSEFLNDLIKAPAAATYYESQTNYYNALNQTQGTAQKAQMRNSFAQWQSQFLAANPTFADYLTQGGAAVKRDDTLREVEHVFDSGQAPAGPQTDHMKVLLDGFRNFEQAYATTDGNYASTVTKQRTAMETDFKSWATQFTTDHPDVSDFWNVLLQPSLGTKALTQGVLTSG